jgi:hypothetical protein
LDLSAIIAFIALNLVQSLLSSASASFYSGGFGY